jgi:hypothetical protein
MNPVVVSLTQDEAAAIQTLCRMQQNKYGLTEEYAIVKAAGKIGKALNEARYTPAHQGSATREEEP